MARFLLLFFTAVAFLIPIVTSSPIPPKKCNVSGTIRDLDSCQMYLECINSMLIPRTCPMGQYFSPKFSSCILIPERDCFLDPTGLDLTNQTCPVDGYKVPGLISCDTYFHCRNGTYFEEQCPKYKYFSDKSRTCVDDDFDEACHRYSSYSETQAYISKETSPYHRKCRNKGSSEILPDPLDCALYLRCAWLGDDSTTMLIIGECGRSRLFSAETKACENASSVLCGDRFRDSMIYGDGENHQRLRRASKHRKITPSAPVKKLRTQPGKYITRKSISPPKSIVKTTPEQPKTTATTAIPKGRGIMGGRGINLGGRPRQSKISGLVVTNRNVNDDFPEFSSMHLPANERARKKRRLKTKVRKAETEFFDEQGNFTNVTQHDKFIHFRPKMRVRLIEMETVYDGTDEELELNYRKDKSPDQIVVKIEQNLDKQVEAPGSVNLNIHSDRSLGQKTNALTNIGNAHSNRNHDLHLKAPAGSGSSYVPPSRGLSQQMEAPPGAGSSYFPSGRSLGQQMDAPPGSGSSYIPSGRSLGQQMDAPPGSGSSYLPSGRSLGQQMDAAPGSGSSYLPSSRSMGVETIPNLGMGTILTRNLNSNLNENDLQNQENSTATPKPKRKKYRPDIEYISVIFQPMHYNDFEAPPGEDDEVDQHIHLPQINFQDEEYDPHIHLPDL